jgi:hypothetical protein
MVVQMHYYQTREQILRLSYERGQLTYRGAKISFYPDLSADLLRRRAAFLPVKKQLREAGVKYSLLHPARLRFVFNGKKLEFADPSKAAAFAKSNISTVGTARNDGE